MFLLNILWSGFSGGGNSCRRTAVSPSLAIIHRLRLKLVILAETPGIVSGDCLAFVQHAIVGHLYSVSIEQFVEWIFKGGKV